MNPPGPGLVIVLGKNWKRGRRKLSVESRLNAIAGVELYERGLASALLFSGGYTAGNHRPSEAMAMARLARLLLPDAPSHVFMLEEDSLDTAGNARHTRPLLEQTELQSVYLLTTANHVPAAVRIFEAYAVRVSAVFSSEDVLRGRSAHYEALLDRHTNSTRSKLDRFREHLRLMLLTIDPQARTLQSLTAWRRRSF